MVLFPSGGKISLQIARNFEELMLHVRNSFWVVLYLWQRTIVAIRLHASFQHPR